ncbi:ricin-type beta-trefoil lectin domain protein [Couchioplanes azureus]|uniref:ricin-type beta-trefoil lectin domain protein n=1 Tax=Couchioplanes caeruleus TaxID=56438 RepID=UPI001671778D|nr:ricin-type beta-trefoil lectin domain protein [Couchioplanes caeruleus]GGQ75169.1 hypothetical protein GCM10010166_51390 [Couchioplanes caeruleus subsp. azureus]
MHRISDGFTMRRLLTAGIAAVGLALASPAAAVAAPALAAPASAAQAADYEQKLAVAVKFGLGDRTDLIERADRDFVIALWKHIKDDSDHLEVRTAAEQAYTTSDAACHQFIVADVLVAIERDAARELREAEEKRRSDLARSTAAAAIDIVAGPEMLNTTDLNFIRLIWESADRSEKWPRVKAAARAARDGSEQEQRDFIATGLAAAAKQDTDDRIRRDEQKTQEQKAAELARAAKQFAANRIGLPVTKELLDLPDRDFVVTVWHHQADGTQVRIAAVQAAGSLVPADWKAFIDTGIHQARDRDIQIALDRKAAEERRLVEDILARAEKAGQLNLPQAARKALAGTPADVAEFLHFGQYAVKPDLPDALNDGVRFGRVTGLGGKCVDIANSRTEDGTPVQLTACNGNDAQDVSSPGDGTLRVFGKCVDAGGPATGAPGDQLVHLWSCNGTGPQRWQQRPNGTIYHPATDRCLDVPSGNDGAQLYVHACNLGEHQQWKLPAASGARFGKVIGVSGKCLDVVLGRNHDGNAVQLYGCNSGSAQDVTIPGDGTLRVVGKCVDAAGPAFGGPGERLVYLWSCNGTPAQQWSQSSDGTLYNALTKFCLDVPSTNEGTQLYVHSCNGGAHQQWKLPKAG